MATATEPSRAQADGNAFVRNVQQNWRQPKVLKSQLENWITESPPMVESLFATVSGSFQGALLGGVMGQFTNLDPKETSKIAGNANNPDLQKQMMALTQTGGPWIQARNFAVFSGVSAGLTTLMRRIRKVDDVRNVMVAGFGSGAAFALVSGMAGPNPLQGAFTSGVLMALAQAAFYQIGSAWSKRNSPADATEYARVRHLLESLGMPQHVNKLRRHHLNDSTIWLWNDSALQSVKGIPAGHRLVLLHHVDRYRHVLRPNVPAPGFPPPPPYSRPPASPNQASKDRK